MTSVRLAVRVERALYHRCKKSGVASKDLFERVNDLASKDVESRHTLPPDDSYGCALEKSVSATIGVAVLDSLEKTAQIHQVSTPSLIRRYLHNRFKELTHARTEEPRLPSQETSNI